MIGLPARVIEYPSRYLGATGQNIRRVREQRGYDQVELARLVGISPSASWKVENKDRTPHGPTLRQLAEGLSVDPSALRSVGGQ